MTVHRRRTFSNTVQRGGLVLRDRIKLIRVNERETAQCEHDRTIDLPTGVLS